jgi:hypothetical protein
MMVFSAYGLRTGNFFDALRRAVSKRQCISKTGVAGKWMRDDNDDMRSVFVSITYFLSFARNIATDHEAVLLFLITLSRESFLLPLVLLVL